MVPNLEKSVWSQHLLKLGSCDHTDSGEKVANFGCTEFSQDQNFPIEGGGGVIR